MCKWYMFSKIQMISSSANSTVNAVEMCPCVYAQTDGEDSHSRIRAHVVTKELQQRGVVVDSIMISQC